MPAATDAGPDLSELPEVTSETEEDFHDLVFAVRRHDVLPDGSQRVVAAARASGRLLEFEVLLGAAWKSGKLSPDLDLVSHRGSVVLSRLGPQSDALLALVDDLYGTKLRPAAMRASAQFTAISLEGNPSVLSAAPVKLKLFFENGREEDYAELFLNVELEKKRLFLREKDPDYRAAVVKALRAQ